MQINVHRKENYLISDWSGGITAQLLIFPEKSKYELRNFLWRISSASVKNEKSVFTVLPAFKRILMVMEGNVLLEHAGFHTIQLGPLEKDKFMGGWSTKCYGKAVDFNLMMSEGCDGDMESISIKSGASLSIPKYIIDGNHINISESFYIVHGRAIFNIQDEPSLDVKEKDILSIIRLTTENEIKIEITNDELSDLVLIRTIVLY